jgi:hypothetical protein
MPKGWQRVPELDRSSVDEAWRNTENGRVIYILRGMAVDDLPGELEWYQYFTPRGGS